MKQLSKEKIYSNVGKENEVRRILKIAAIKYAELFTPFIGKKVLKTDKTWIKAIQDAMKPLYSSVQAEKITHPAPGAKYAGISLVSCIPNRSGAYVRVSLSFADDNGKDCCHYIDGSCWIVNIDYNSSVLRSINTDSAAFVAVDPDEEYKKFLEYADLMERLEIVESSLLPVHRIK